MYDMSGTRGVQSFKYCSQCGKTTLHKSYLFRVGCLLLFLTCGWILPVRMLMDHTLDHWVCKECGTRRVK